MNEGTLIIVRGLPGSGKSTLCAHLKKDLLARIVEVDSYLTKDNVYTFTERNMALARLEAREELFYQIERNIKYVNPSPIVFDDVNALFVEYADIASVASMNGLKVKIVQFNPMLNPLAHTLMRLKNKSKHNVAVGDFFRMWYEFQPDKSWPKFEIDYPYDKYDKQALYTFVSS